MGKLVMGYWDCPYCSTKHIEGTKRECPSCGKPRGQEVKFYMDGVRYLSAEESRTKGKVPTGYAIIAVITILLLTHGVAAVALNEVQMIKLILMSGKNRMQRMPEVHPEQEQLPEDKTAGRGVANGAAHLEHGR